MEAGTDAIKMFRSFVRALTTFPGSCLSEYFCMVNTAQYRSFLGGNTDSVYYYYYYYYYYLSTMHLCITLLMVQLTS